MHDPRSGVGISFDSMRKTREAGARQYCSGCCRGKNRPPAWRRALPRGMILILIFKFSLAGVNFPSGLKWHPDLWTARLGKNQSALCKDPRGLGCPCLHVARGVLGVSANRGAHAPGPRPWLHRCAGHGSMLREATDPSYHPDAAPSSEAPIPGRPAARWEDEESSPFKGLPPPLIGSN